MVLSTGIGSHPISDMEQIFRDLIDSEISLLYFPQLKKEHMIHAYYCMIPGLKYQMGKLFLNLNQFQIEKDLETYRNDLLMRKSLLKKRNFSLDDFNLIGLNYMRHYLEKYKPQIKGIKGQITGPLSEVFTVKIEPVNKRAIDIPEFLELFIQTAEEVAFSIDSIISHLNQEFVGNQANSIIFIDEPSLSIVLKELDIKKASKYLKRVFNSISGKKGIHVCDNLIGISEFILDLPVDYINFDVRTYPKTIEYLDDDKVIKFLENGGGFALGLIPNTPESLVGEENIDKIQKKQLKMKDFLPSIDSLIKKFELILEQFRHKGIQDKQVLENLIITPQCGFRSFDIPTPVEGEQMVKELLIIQEKLAKNIEKIF